MAVNFSPLSRLLLSIFLFVGLCDALRRLHKVHTNVFSSALQRHHWHRMSMNMMPNDSPNLNDGGNHNMDAYESGKEEREGWTRSDIRRETEAGSGGHERRVYTPRNNDRHRVSDNRSRYSDRTQTSGSNRKVGGFRDALSDQWQSGNNVFKNKNNRRGGRRNDPWWMRDEEKNNPRVLPVYKPWWLVNNVMVDTSWKVADLREEAIRRGITKEEANDLKKDKLVEMLQDLTQKYRLSSDTFTEPLFSAIPETAARPSCFPTTYEGLDGIATLNEEILEQIAASSQSK
jgi:hypothetical protein